MLKQIQAQSNIVLGDGYNELKTDLVSAGVSFVYFDYDEDNKNFKIENLEEVKSFTSSYSSSARYVVVSRSIRDTRMQSALLKMFEEPASNVYYVFFVQELDSLLPTIISRCQVIDNTKSENRDIKSIIINNTKSQNRFKRLKDFLTFENLNRKGLVSDKQMQEYKRMM